MRVESLFRPFVVNRADKKQHNRGGSGWQMAWETDAHQGVERRSKETMASATWGQHHG